MGSWRSTLEAAIARAAEALSAALLVIEILVIGAGVVSRYVFHSPLFWVDELASVLFVWLSMLGAVVALERGEHMRMASFVDWVSPEWRRRLAVLSYMLVALSSFLIVPPALHHVQSQAIVSMPSLDISEAYRASAVLVGSVLLCIVATLRVTRIGTFAEASVAIAVAALGAGLIWLGRPMLLAMGNFNLIVFFVVLLAGFIVIGLPIAFTFILCTASYLLMTGRSPLLILVSRMEEGMSSMILLAIPLFIYLGLLIEVTGVARALVNFMSTLVGHIRGGLSYVLLGAMFLVSGISGSKAADMAAVAPGLLPEMKRRGFEQGELGAQLAASAVMTETIPPSLVLIMIGASTGVSISALFTGGLMPAVICTIALAATVAFRARRENATTVPRPPARDMGRAFLIAIPALLLPFVIRTAVVEGVATATEVSTIGVFYTLAVGLAVYRELPWNRMYPILVATAALTGAVLLILGMAIAMAWALTQSGFARQLVVAMTAVPGGWIGFMMVSILGFVVLGSVLEGLPAILVFAPLLFPASRALGIHDVHYSMVIIIAMGIGLYAPPLGIGYYSACAIARVPPDDVLWRIWPYLGVLLLVLVVIAVVPWISIGFL